MNIACLVFYLFFFNRIIIALQCYIGFCLTTVWISHKYNANPLPLQPSCHKSLHPLPLGLHKTPDWVPCVIQQLACLVLKPFNGSLQCKFEFGNKEFMIWATVRSWSCFCGLYRASPSFAAENIINLISVLTIWWWACVKSCLVLLEEGVCLDQCIFLAKLY